MDQGALQDAVARLAASTTPRPTARARMHALSAREREIARLLVEGYSVLNAAALLDISENTVRTYVRRLYQKLGISSRLDLVRELAAA